MVAERTYLKVINILARAVGVIWVLGGLVFLVSSFVIERDRVIYLVVSVFLLAAGTGLLLVRPARQQDLARFKGAR